MVKGGSATPGELVLYPPTGVADSWAVRLRAPETSTTDSAPITQYSLTLPVNKPQASQLIQTDGNGQLSFVDASVIAPPQTPVDLQDVLTEGNVSDQSINLASGNDIIHIDPSANSILIAGNSESSTPKFILGNYDGSSTDNSF